MVRHVLLPTDGSELSVNAVKAGIEMAKAQSATVTIYHALEPFPVWFHSGSPQIRPDLMQRLEEERLEAGARLAGEAQRLAEQAGVPVNSEVDRPNSPADGIAEAAKRLGCDMIFMGSHGRTGVSRLILGSVAQKVLARSDLPVVIYRAAQAKAG
jgi:nucleotide-binding universal stress UspA family protein